MFFPELHEQKSSTGSDMKTIMKNFLKKTQFFVIILFLKVNSKRGK